MINYFRVLIIDDDLEVIKRLPERILREQRYFEGRTWSIDLRVVHVKVEKINENHYQIANSTFEELASACSQPPHLILADYGYAQKEIISTLKHLSDQGKEIKEEDLIGKVFTTADLAAAVQKFILDSSVDSYKRNSLKKNFLESSAKLYLYSYTSKDFIKALRGVEARANRTKAALPNCKVIPVDTKHEFYNGEEFDYPNPTKHDGKFYAHLVGGLINHLIQIEFIEHILEDAKRLKYVRVRRSTVSVGIIVALGGAIGAFSEWLGGRVLDLFSHGFLVPAFTIVGLAVVFILIIGLVVPVAFERVMTGLLTKRQIDEES